MAISLNRATILGFSGRAAELRQTTAGASVANFTVATTSRWKDKAGTTQEQTTWHNVTAWGALAELCEQVVQQGTRVYVDGPMCTESFTARDGSQKTKTYIKADQVISMSTGRDRVEDGREAKVRAPSPVTVRDQAPAWTDSDIPF